MVYPARVFIQTLVDVNTCAVLESKPDSAVAGETVFFLGLRVTSALGWASVDSVFTWVDTLANVAGILHDKLVVIFLLDTDALALIISAAWPVL